MNDRQHGKLMNGHADGRRRRCRRIGTPVLLTASLMAVAMASGGLSSAADAAVLDAGSKAPIIVCDDTALSGKYALGGGGPSNGAKAYIKMINAKGGMSGHQVKLVLEDDQSSAAVAATVARKCVTQDHANFVIGPENSATAVGAVSVLNSLKTVSIGTYSGWKNIGLKSADLHSYAFPGNFDVFQQFDLSAIQIMVVRKHLTKVGVIESATPSGLETTPYLKSIAKKYGFRVVASESVDPSATDVTPQVLNVLAAKPQAIVSGLTPGTPTITGIKALRAQNPHIPIGLCVTCDDPAFVAAAGGQAQMVNVYNDAAIPLLIKGLPRTKANTSVLSDLKRFVSAMRAAGFGSTQDLDTDAPGFQAAEELDNAIHVAGSISENAVRNALRHQHMVAMDIRWARTPSDYAGLKNVYTAVDVIGQNGQPKLVGVTSGGPGN